MKKIFLFVSITVFFLITGVTIAYATSNSFIRVPTDETVDRNFYGFGEQVIIDGNVEGDVVAFGTTIIINGTVIGDVIAAGSSVDINGEVKGSVHVAGAEITINGPIENNLRAAGANIILNSTVGKNALLASGTLTMLNDAEIGWTLTAGTGLANLKGKINGHMDISAGEVNLNGTVGGDVRAEIEKTFTLQKNASIGGDLAYRAPKRLSFDTDKVKGDLEYKEPKITKKPKAYWPTALLSFWAIGFISMLILALLGITIAPKLTMRAVKSFWETPGKNIGYGILWIIFTPLAIFVLMITIVGIPLALITGAIYLMLLYFANILAGIAIGAKIFKRMQIEKQNQKEEKTKKTKSNGKAALANNPTQTSLPSLVLPTIVGMLIVTILSSIPFIGWIMGFVFIAWGFHAIMRLKKQYCESLNK